MSQFRNFLNLPLLSKKMKIASIEVHPLSAPTEVPLSTAHETFSTSSFILVEVRTDDGLTGYGRVHGEPMKQMFDATRYAGFSGGLRVAYLVEQHGARMAPHLQNA